MNKEQFLGTSLHTGLKFTSVMDDAQGMPPSNRIWTCNGLMQLFGDLCLNTLEGSDAYPIQSITIIARPLSDMTKPITHNGETFVPLVELAKIADMNVTDDFKCVEHHNAWGVRFKDEDDEGVFYEILSYSSNTNSFSTQTIQGEDITSERVLEMTFNQLQLFQKLIEWHFNLMDESEPFIPVTEELNPYK